MPRMPWHAACNTPCRCGRWIAGVGRPLQTPGQCFSSAMALDEPGALAGLDDQEQQEQQPSSPLVKQEPNADADAPDDAGVLVGLEEAAASEAGLKRGRDSDTGANEELEEPCSKRSNGLKEVRAVPSSY
jgi:hypothetical protein